MKGFENLTEQVASDLITLVNSISGLEKSKYVSYQTKAGKTSFHYVPLDDILSKIKENNNFALMQPIGTDEQGITGVKCILIHKSGHVLESDTYPFHLNENAKLQDVGSEITYRKRYALGSFLGMATEEDNDGNDSDALDVSERKATRKQIETLLKHYKGAALDALLKENNIQKIDEITLKVASNLIRKIITKV